LATPAAAHVVSQASVVRAGAAASPLARTETAEERVQRELAAMSPETRRAWNEMSLEQRKALENAFVAGYSRPKRRTFGVSR